MSNFRLSPELNTFVSEVLGESVEDKSFDSIRVNLENDIEELEHQVRTRLFTKPTLAIELPYFITSEIRVEGQKLYKAYDLLMEEFTNQQK